MFSALLNKPFPSYCLWDTAKDDHILDSAWKYRPTRHNMPLDANGDPGCSGMKARYDYLSSRWFLVSSPLFWGGLNSGVQCHVFQKCLLLFFHVLDSTMEEI